MRDRLRISFVVGMITFIALSLSFGTVFAQSDSEASKENYKNLLNTTDGIIRSLRFGKDESAENRLSVLEDNYYSVFPDAGPEFGNKINSLENKSDLKIENIKALRSMVVETGRSNGLSLPFIYKYAVLVILGVSFGLSFTANMISRVFVDWEKVNRVKREQSELKDELNEARKESNTKKVHKLQSKQQEFMQEHMGTLFSPMKTIIIIIIPFIIVFSLMRGAYGGWVVAWLPFNLPWPHIGLPLLNRFFSGTIASLGFFGWYILSYFGFSQFWRKILIPSQ